MNYHEEFTNLYNKLGIYEVPLHLNCSKARECWHNGESRYPSDKYSFIAAPWVGKNYLDTGLLLLGKNLNEWGGFHAIETCVNEAREKITRNKGNIFLWNAIFGLILLGKMGKAKTTEEDYDFRNIKQERIKLLYDYVAFTNMIKCSPVGDRSAEVTEDMWSNCAHHVLSKELNILKPKIIVCFGLDGFSYLLDLQESQFEQKADEVGFQVYENKSDCFPKYIVGTYHPAYPKQSNHSVEIINRFKNFELKIS